MSVLDRASLEQSPLADLYAIASELSIDGYRRLRRGELIDAILERQEGAERVGPEEAAEEPAAARGRRGRRGRRATSREGQVEAGEEELDGEAAENGGPFGEGPEETEEQLERAQHMVEGVVELLPNGSGFARVDPPEPSDDDVYISAAQVKRCELVTGDRVTGPRRPPRRSERFASLLRIDTVNGRPAAELVDSARFEELPASFPSEPFRFDSDDPTIALITERLPIGRGSRAAIVGERQSGKSETLRRLAIALAGQDRLQLRLVLAGVRPEEIPEWRAGPIQPAASVSLASSTDAQAQAVESVIEQTRRLAARGEDAVVLIDTVEGLPHHLARRMLAAARNIVDGGSLTIIATAPAALGGETCVIALDAALAQAGTFPAVDIEASWTMRAELLMPGAG